MDQLRKFCNYLHPLHIPTLFKPPSDFPLIQFLAINKVIISYRISTLFLLGLQVDIEKTTAIK